MSTKIERRNDGTRWATISADLMSEGGAKFERTVKVTIQLHYDFGRGAWTADLEDFTKQCRERFPWIMRKKDLRILFNNTNSNVTTSRVR